MLRKIRIAMAVTVMALLTSGFVDLAGVVENPLLQKVQFAPALLSLSVVTLAILVTATLLLGRVYCSVICPLGILQDLFNWLSKKFDKKKKYGYKEPHDKLRLGVLALLVLAWFCGFTLLVSLLEPYSAYGRVATQIFKPLYILGNNLLAKISQSAGNYTFFFVELTVRSAATFAVALLTLMVVGFISYKWGRTWCNTVCPVGTLLGFLSKHALMRVTIDKEKCNHCSLCSRNCKAYCIDSKNQTIDYSRCVGCFDCLENCRQNALSFTFVKRASKSVESSGAADESRRNFLKSTVSLTALALPSALRAGDNSGSKGPKRVPLSPPGSVGHKNLTDHCTACNLCISKCPSKVLKPAGLEYGLGGFMQPVMSFEKGYCNYDCTLCGEVCPNGAIKPLTVEQKHTVQPGRVVFLQGQCVVSRNHSSCGACAEHCPTQAVSMVEYKDGLTIPSTNPDLCVGCGGCEYICPVHAIYIEGNPVHLTATEPVQEEIKISDDIGFGF